MANHENYKLILRTRAGVKVAEITDFEWLSASKAVNRAGLLRWRLPGSHASIAKLEHRGQVELKRRDPSQDLDWYTFWSGFWVGQRWEQEEAAVVELTAAHDLWLLGTRVIAYPASTTNRSAFYSQPGETIMKTLVDYNLGANATTANGRLRDGTGIPHTLNIETDLGRGNSLDWFCMGDNLLTNLQDLALVAGGDFGLEKTGTNTYEFRFYPGQLGTDRTAAVKFTLDRGNLVLPQYEHNRHDEATVAIVGGLGEGDDRDFTIRTGADYAATQNDIEVFVNASNQYTSGSLEATGDKKLEELRALKNFDFEVQQIASTALDVHYTLGDLVTVLNDFTGESLTKRVDRVTITLSQEGEELIDIDVVNVP